MEFLFLVKQLITVILFFIKVSKETKQTIQSVMDMMMLEYPQTITELEDCDKKMVGGAEQVLNLEGPTPKEPIQYTIDKSQEKVEEKMSEKDNIREQRDKRKKAEEELKDINKELKDLKKIYKNQTEEEGKKELKTELIAKLNEKKQKEKELYDEKIKTAQMMNTDYDKKNPEFAKFKDLVTGKDGPIQGIYKIFRDTINTVVNLVKMFFVFLYQKSMMTFLPFVATMSVAFSFIRYLFQNVRNR